MSSCIFLCPPVSLCVLLFNPVSSCFILFLPVSSCFLLFLPISIFTVSSCVLLFPHVSSYVLVCLFVSSCILLCPPVSCCFLMYPPVFSCVLLCLHVSSCVFLCPAVFYCVLLFSPVSSCQSTRSCLSHSEWLMAEQFFFINRVAHCTGLKGIQWWTIKFCIMFSHKVKYLGLTNFIFFFSFFFPYFFPTWEKGPLALQQVCHISQRSLLWPWEESVTEEDCLLLLIYFRVYWLLMAIFHPNDSSQS